MMLDSETEFDDALEQATDIGAAPSAYKAASAWSDRNIKLCVKLWADGQTASTIAEALGNNLSRNAVIGKLHRIANSSTPVIIDGEVMVVDLARASLPRRATNAQILARAQQGSATAREAIAAKEASAAKRGRKTFGTAQKSRRGAPAAGRPSFKDMAAGIALNPTGGARLSTAEDDLAEQSPTIQRLINNPQAWGPLPGLAPVSILDAVKGQCRWPVEVDADGAPLSGHFCCGAAVVEEGRSWCEAHARRTERKVPTANPETRRRQREAERQIARAFG